VETKADRNARSTGKGALAGAVAVSRATEKQLKLKENMLNRLRKTEDRHNAELLVLRERINNLRVEAMDRNKVFDGMAADLHRIKAELVVALDRSNTVLAERNELSDQLKAVRAEDAEHKLIFEARLKELRAQIDTMQAALVKAAKEGKLAASAPSDADDDKKDPDGGPGSGNLTEEQEEAARANIMKLDHLIREFEGVVRDLHAQTAQLQEVFKHMIAQAGLERLDQLVERFAEEEAYKYEIFG
jgi:DNA repair exonuclease SbcCD ATPase subunit